MASSSISLQDLPLKSVEAEAKLLTAKAAVFNGSDADGYQYVICASDRDVSAFGKAFNTALCGRGGGKNPMIQGQVKAEQKAIWEYLTKGGVLQDGK